MNMINDGWSNGSSTDFEGVGWDNKNSVSPSFKEKGSWHAVQSAVSLLATSAGAFAVAYLTRNIQDRPFWMIGLIFFIPATMVMLTNFFLESATDAMTPRYTRNAQTVVVLLASVLAFLIGIVRFPEAAKQEPAPASYLFLMDRSTSMDFYDPYNQSAEAVEKLLTEMPPNTMVGLLLFTHEIVGEVPIAALSAQQLHLLHQSLLTSPDGLTEFQVALDRAREMLKETSLPKESSMSVIIVTDGESEITPDFSEQLIKDFKAQDITVSGIKIGNDFDPVLENILLETGGQSVVADQATQLSEKMGSFVTITQPHDLLRDNSNKARTLSGVLFAAVGIELGIALTLMLSLSKQKRFQLLLSPLMGVAAFSVCKLSGDFIQPDWLREAVSFSLFGLVFMQKNNHSLQAKQGKVVASDVSETLPF